MESVSLRHVMFATNRRNPVSPIRIRRRIHWKTGRFRFGVIHSKQSDFQDFQGYAKPSLLLPATEVKVCTENSQEKIFLSINVYGSRSLYKVKLQTSSIYGSSLSNLNAGILLCLIDENSESILQRIPASLVTDDSTESVDMVDPERIGFQRGSVDEFTFEGPKLGKIEALWVSLESGQWRIGGVSLTVIDAYKPSLEENDGEKFDHVGYKYDFEAADILLGEGGNLSMVELRPCVVTEVSGVNPITLLSKSVSQSTSPLGGELSNEESMKEYADLKFSLLLYDAILIFVGTSVATFSAGENSGIAFLIGGITGFLYLLLLQRSVDGLQVPALTSKNPGGNFDQMFGELKGPLSTLALAVGFSSIALKYSSGDVPLMLTPKELLIGMMGFLACKVAVVLAAFKPIPVDLEENK